MKNPFKLAAWLPIKARMDEAKAFARQVASRHDVPTHVQAHDEDGEPIFDKGKPVMTTVAPDLRDIRGRWWGAGNGKSIASLMLPEEFIQGSQSSITPVLMGLMTVLTVLGIQLQNFGMAATVGSHTNLAAIAHWLSLGTLGVIALLFFALWSAIGASGNRLVLAGSVLIPAIGMVGGLTSALPTTDLRGLGTLIGAGGGMLSGLAKWGLPLAAVLVILFMFVGKRDSTKRFFIGMAQVMVFLAVTAWMAKSFLPLWMHPLYWAFVGCLVPAYWNYTQEKIRAARLAMGSQVASGDLKPLGNTNAQKRLEQAQAAEKDKSGFIPLGIAKGELTKYGDGFSPDDGIETGLTCNDLRTHLHVFGKTGGGKTFNLFTPAIQWWNIHNAGGSLVLDGKGSAGEELIASFIAKYGLKHRVFLIKPGIRLGLMEGLTPNDFIDAIFDVGGALKQEASKKDSSEFFVTQARTFGLSIARILWKLVDHQRGSDERTFFLTIEGVDRLKVSLKQKNNAGEEILKAVKGFAAYANDPLLQDSVRYIEHDFWTQPTDQAGGIVSTFDNTIKDLLAHPELRAWASMETGVDVTIPTTGGFVALALPEVKYGQAGKLVQSLIKQRLFVKIRRRGDYDWKSAGEVPVLFATDEAQELISQADRDFLPQSRGLGGYAVYCTQSYDEYESRMGDAATRAFLGNFRSKAAFESTAKTYEYLSKEMGRGRYVIWSAAGQAINWVGTAQRVAASPLHDPTHPDARFMRQLRREGAGQVFIPTHRQPHFRTDGKGWKMADAHTRLMNRGAHGEDGMPGDTASAIYFMASMSLQIENRDLLTMEDCASNLNSERDAIVSFRRAGSPRHDFVSFPILTPDQVKEREERFHRALLFNSLVYTLQCDLVAALGERPKAGPLRRLTMAMIHLLLNDERFAKAYEDGLDARLLGQIQERVDRWWKQVGHHGRKAWQARAVGDRELFIQRYIDDLEALKKAA